MIDSLHSHNSTIVRSGPAMCASVRRSIRDLGSPSWRRSKQPVSVNMKRSLHHQLPKSHQKHFSPQDESERWSCAAKTKADPNDNSSLRYSASTTGPLPVGRFPLLPQIFTFSLIITHMFASSLAITTTTALHWHSHRSAENDQTRLAWSPSADQSYRLIPSARYVYTTSSLASSSAPQQRSSEQSLAKRDKILALHSQLNHLKRKLDAELNERDEPAVDLNGSANDQRSSQAEVEAKSAAVSTQVTLGSPCLSTSFCNKSIRNSQCNLESFTCVCLSQHVKLNSTTCLAPTLLGYECQLDGQCQQRVPESVCQNGKCACPQGAFVPYRKNKCLVAAKLDEYCLLDDQCRLNDKHSFCKWKIQNIYGTCKCPPNYKLLSDHQNNPKCVPRLGDACLSSRECQLATANSICRDQLETTPSRAKMVARQVYNNNNNKWPTSSASNSRCVCSAGFKESHNQLDCVRDLAFASKQPPVPTTTLSSKTNGTSGDLSELRASSSSEVAQRDSNKYEMIVIPGQEQANNHTSGGTAAAANSTTKLKSQQGLEELEIKLMPSAPAVAATTTKPSTTTEGPRLVQKASTGSPPTNVSLAISGVRASSLGKSCRSRQECQARDPFSDCIEGVCECLAPSARCRASRTGCHPDTFQCRNGQCISWYFVCDQFRNCDDGSDEDECTPRHCPRESFQCRGDGACLTKGKVCNGLRDCLDGSDELDCGRTHEPQAGVAARPAVAQAVNNGSLAVAFQRGGCPADAFTCFNGQCLPGYVFCNAVRDCADGSDEDELICERKQTPTTLNKGQTVASANDLAGGIGSNATSGALQTDEGSNATRQQQQQQQQESPLVKTDRASIERLMASLALGKWMPESRGRIKPPTQLETARKSKLLPAGAILETAARAESTTTSGVALAKSNHLTGERDPAALVNNNGPGECPRWAFTCRNGKCRSSAILCSGVDGCGDNSDEDRCEVCQCEPPPPSVAAAHAPRAINSRRRLGWAATPV